MNKSTLACTLSCCAALLFAACEGKHEIGTEMLNSGDAGGAAEDAHSLPDATTHDDAAGTDDAGEAEDAHSLPDATEQSEDAISFPDATESSDAGATDAAECILAHDPLGPCNQGSCPTGSLCVSGNCFGCANGDCTPCIGADQ